MNDEFSSLVELLRWRAARQGNQVAYTYLVDGEEEAVSITYAELDRQARAIAVRLQEMGMAGERALLLYPPGLEFIAAFFGCLCAGVVGIPAYPPRRRRSEQQLVAMASDSEAALALTSSGTLSDVERWLADVADLKEVNALATDRLDLAAADTWQEPNVDGDTLAYLQYTSGSTSSPKGVMVSHGNVLHNQRMIKEAFGHTEQSTFVSWLPRYHDMGLVGDTVQPLYLGVSCIFMSSGHFLQKPLRWLQAISHYRGHTAGGPNFTYDLCVRKVPPESRETLDLSCWRVAYVGAEPVRRQTLEQFAEAFEVAGFHREALYPCYGLAEASVLVSGGLSSEAPRYCWIGTDAVEENRIVVTSPGAEEAQPLAACGRAWGTERIVIADPETGTRCEADRVGEVWVCGPNVVRGYWNRAQ